MTIFVFEVKHKSNFSQVGFRLKDGNGNFMGIVRTRETQLAAVGFHTGNDGEFRVRVDLRLGLFFSLVFGLDRKKLDFENERGVRANLGTSSPVAVGKVGGNKKLPL
jgi:hypothetical protein